jgi:DNA replication protein DnaC
MDKELTDQLKSLRLPRLLAQWDEDLKAAAQQRFSHARLLTHVVEHEYRQRCENARQQRLRRARIPEPWVLETYPFARQPKLNKKAIQALYDSSSYLTQNQNIIWLGPTGVGKTGLATSFLTHAIHQPCWAGVRGNHASLATSFLTHAIHQGKSGRYILFAQLIAELYQSIADHTQAKVLKHYLSYDVLQIDELGYAQVEPAQVGLFFTLLQQRHKKKPTLITSNLGFEDWNTFLKNPSLTAALIDRLTENSHVFNLRECVSLRLKRPADPA